VTSFMIALATFTSALVSAGLTITRYATQVMFAVVVTFSFGIAGNSLNDYFDREVDRINHPERPIPSGKVTPRQALNLSVTMFCVSILMAFFLGLSAGFESSTIVLTAFALQVVYEMKFKHFKFVGNVVIGLQTALAIIFGATVVKNIIPVVILAAAAFLSIVGREMVKDIADLKGDFDRLTLPMTIGTRKASVVAAFLIILAVIISPLPCYPLRVFGVEYLLPIVVADTLFIYSMPMIFRSPKYAQRVLKISMIIAIIGFIVGGIFR